MTEVGTTVQNDPEEVVYHYTTDYLSLANRDILVEAEGEYVTRYVYGADSERVSAEYSFAENTNPGESGENIVTGMAANDVGKVYFRHSLLDSTLFAVDEDGEVIAHMIYDAWGNPQTTTKLDANYAGIDNLNNFTGYTYDETLNLYFAQNRFYNPETHRFTQEDPIKDGGNWYGYCDNNPTGFVDPTGCVSDALLRSVAARYASGAISSQVAGEEIIWNSAISEPAFLTTAHNIAQVLTYKQLNPNRYMQLTLEYPLPGSNSIDILGTMGAAAYIYEIKARASGYSRKNEENGYNQVDRYRKLLCDSTHYGYTAITDVQYSQFTYSQTLVFDQGDVQILMVVEPKRIGNPSVIDSKGIIVYDIYVQKQGRRQRVNTVKQAYAETEQVLEVFKATGHVPNQAEITEILKPVANGIVAFEIAVLAITGGVGVYAGASYSVTTMASKDLVQYAASKGVTASGNKNVVYVCFNAAKEIIKLVSAA